MKKPTLVTKTALAQELGYTRGRISQLAKSGMPVCQNGKVDREAALKWIEDNVVSHLGGWGMGQRGAKEARHRRPRKPKAFTGSEISGARLLLDRLFENAGSVPAIALQAGVKDMNLVGALPEIFKAVVFRLAGPDLTDILYDWNADEEPAYTDEPNFAELAKRYGVALPDPKQVEALLEKFDSDTALPA